MYWAVGIPAHEGSNVFVFINVPAVLTVLSCCTICISSGFSSVLQLSDYTVHQFPFVFLFPPYFPDIFIFFSSLLLSIFLNMHYMFIPLLPSLFLHLFFCFYTFFHFFLMIPSCLSYSIFVPFPSLSFSFPQ